MLSNTLRSDRKILDRVPRSKNIPSRSLCLRKWTSFLASGHSRLRLIIHSSTVSVSEFRMWTRVGVALDPPAVVRTTYHWFLKFACLCCGVIVGCSGVLSRVCPNLSWFRVCGCFLACTYNLCWGRTWPGSQTPRPRAECT